MGRMYGKGKGIASSATPYRRKAPAWVKMKPEDVCDHICKLAKKGLTPSQIGVTLRDSFGVPQVKTVTGNKVHIYIYTYIYIYIYIYMCVYNDNVYNVLYIYIYIYI